MTARDFFSFATRYAWLTPIPIMEKNLKLTKQHCVMITALAVLCTAINCRAFGAENEIRRPTLLGCAPPEWTDEARRYELEGTTVLQYDVDDEGRPSSVRVVHSSGWKILDQMTMRAVATCRFQPSTDPNVVRAGLRAPYNWKLAENGQTPAQARLVAGSCAPSQRVAGFEPFEGKVPQRKNGILVRFLLDEKGNTFGIKVEEPDPAPVSAATAYIQSCRFSPAMLNGEPVHGNLTGWLILK